LVGGGRGRVVWFLVGGWNEIFSFCKSPCALIVVEGNVAESRQEILPSELQMCVMESGEPSLDNNYHVSKYLPGKLLDSSLSPKDPNGEDIFYMPGRFSSRVSVWRGLGACDMVLGWIEHGFMALFHTECPGWSKANQPSCFEPPAHPKFISDSVAQLLARGVVGAWGPVWGDPKVISPLKVVPKKGNKFRLILDLSRLNKYLTFPKFKYDNIEKVGEVFGSGDYLFAWDLKDGYWHQELHRGMWQFMCFEWEGRLLFFRCMPFGLAPACWVFTKLIRVLVDFWRSRGLSCLSYIDDSLGGHGNMARALFFRNLVIETLLDAGWFINWAKSEWDLSHRAEFIGYRLGTLGLGFLEPSLSRVEKLEAGLIKVLAARTVSARNVAKIAGYIVSLRPVFDPMALLFTKHMYIWLTRVQESVGWDYRVGLEPEVRQEFRIWKVWLPRWVRKSLWSNGAPPVWVQAQDASDSAVGGWLGMLGGLGLELDKKGRQHLVGFTEEALEAVGRLDRWDQEQSSTYRELFALFFMIDSFKDRLRGSSVLVQADNRALFFICSSGKTKSLVIHSLLVRLFWLCKEYSIEWDIVWLPRELNQWADDLSKFVDPDDWKLSERVWVEIVGIFRKFDREFSCDRFAADGANVLDCFCALHWCPGVWFVDCFSRSWSEGFSWWHPNPRDVPRVLAKVRNDRAGGALLVPLWPGSWWWGRLCPDGRHFGDLVRGWFELERSHDLFIKGPSRNFWSRESPRSRILVVWLDGLDLQEFRPGRLGFCSVGGCSDCEVNGCFC